MATNELPYLLFCLGEETYAISAEFVREILRTPVITSVPEMASEIRGVINLRGKVIKVVDLRRRLGMKLLSEELQAFDDMLQQRKQDHINWLQVLENCIREGHEFNLPTDPHQCKFGRWYYSYKTNNHFMAKHLPRFEEPHNAIHQTAVSAIREMHLGFTDKALAIIEARRNTELSQMIQLFDMVQRLLYETNSEITIVLNIDSQLAAITVDRVLSVERLSDEELQDPPDILRSFDYLLKIARLKTGQLVSVLNPVFIFR